MQSINGITKTKPIINHRPGRPRPVLNFSFRVPSFYFSPNFLQLFSFPAAAALTPQTPNTFTSSFLFSLYSPFSFSLPPPIFPKMGNKMSRE
jgi:hypothetical protein